MTFSINEFNSAILKRGGIQSTNRFLVTMTPPPALFAGGNYNSISRDMEFWCSATNLPGYQIATHAAKRWTYGPDEKRPFTPIYQPVNLRFNADNNGDYLRFFNSWLQFIMPHDWYNSFNSTETKYPSQNGGKGQYDLEYKLNYATDITIATFAQSGSLVSIYILKEAFPVAVSDEEFDWERQSDKQTFTVNIEYLDWVEKN